MPWQPLALTPRAEASGVYQAQFCNALCRAGPSSRSLSIRATTTPLPLTTSSRPRSLRSLKSLMLIPVNWNHQLQNHLQDVQKARSFTAALDILPERSLCDCGRTSEPPVKAALEHECPLCELHQRPAGVPVSSMPRNTTFNQRVQADTQWIQIPGQRQQQPVLMISDCTTRLLAGRHLRGGERTEEFIKQLERAWTRNFGPMEVVQVDEHRAGSSDQMREWCTEQVIQVTRRAVALFLGANPTIAAEP